MELNNRTNYITKTIFGTPRTNLILVNQEDHRFQDGGDEEEREDNHEQQLNIPVGNPLKW